MNDDNHEAPVDVLIPLRDELRRFAADRDWDQFHSLKNLAGSIMGGKQQGRISATVLTCTFHKRVHLRKVYSA